MAWRGVPGVGGDDAGPSRSDGSIALVMRGRNRTNGCRMTTNWPPGPLVHGLTSAADTLATSSAPFAAELIVNPLALLVLDGNGAQPELGHDEASRKPL